MSAIRLALGLDTTETEVSIGDLVLTVSQLVAFRSALASKVAQLAETEVTDPLELQFRRGEISAIALIINTSIEAVNSAKED